MRRTDDQQNKACPEVCLLVMQAVAQADRRDSKSSKLSQRVQQKRSANTLWGSEKLG